MKFVVVIQLELTSLNTLTIFYHQEWSAFKSSSGIGDGDDISGCLQSQSVIVMLNPKSPSKHNKSCNVMQEPQRGIIEPTQW